jgi:hypothetical protein
MRDYETLSDVINVAAEWLGEALSDPISAHDLRTRRQKITALRDVVGDLAYDNYIKLPDENELRKMLEYYT